MNLKVLGFTVLAALGGCDNPKFAAPTDPLVDAADYIGERANDARDYMADHNITGEDVGKGTMDAKDDVGSTANNTRDYLYDRGLCDARNGKDCHVDNSSAPTNVSGADGKDGATGAMGSTGAAGAMGP
jgi:hypothetical protein